MKKAISIFLVITFAIILASQTQRAYAVVGIKKEPKKAQEPIGDLSDIFATMSVYCTEWNKTVGASFKTDLTIDFNNYSVAGHPDIESNMAGDNIFVFDIDGILFELDITTYQVYSISVSFGNDAYDSYQKLARVCAAIYAIAYDFPKTDKEMKQRYIDMIEVVVDEIELLNKTNGYSNSASSLPFIQRTEKGTFIFYLKMTESGIVFSTKQ